MESSLFILLLDDHVQAAVFVEVNECNQVGGRASKGNKLIVVLGGLVIGRSHHECAQRRTLYFGVDKDLRFAETLS